METVSLGTFRTVYRTSLKSIFQFGASHLIMIIGLKSLYRFDCSTTANVWTRLNITELTGALYGQFSSPLPSHKNDLLIWNPRDGGRLTFVPGPGVDVAVHTFLPHFPIGVSPQLVVS